jgi:hypothetical protein
MSTIGGASGNTHPTLGVLLRLVAIATGLYGIYEIADGAIRGRPFLEYDIGFFFLFAVVPLWLAAKLVEESPWRSLMR